MLEDIVTQIISKSTTEILQFLASDKPLTIDDLEDHLTPKVQEMVSGIAGAYLEELDDMLMVNLLERQVAGYKLEHRKRPRRLLSRFGVLNFQRNYYKNEEGYSYPLDAMLGIGKRSRLSTSLAEALCDAARKLSYAQSSKQVIGGLVSRQTVMNKLRLCEVEEVEIPDKARVNALHIDADEAHVVLRGGKKSQVELISVYEGIAQEGSRHFCGNVFHLSAYGKSSDDLWELALTEVERRYNLEKTAIYLHGDGAAWIKSGLAWLPNAVFVLDKYHKNKAIKQLLSGLEKKQRSRYNQQLRQALFAADKQRLAAIAEEVAAHLPQRVDKITQNATYLANHIAGIAICQSDPEANNGGCTEPHVSHILAARLSSRPMAWSEPTLRHLAPLLAGSGRPRLHTNISRIDTRLNTFARQRVRYSLKEMSFSASAASRGNLPVLSQTVHSPLSRTIKAISDGWLSLL